jgi:ribonuclease P protein component
LVAGSPGERFRRADRVRKRKDFLRIQGQGHKVQTRHLIALWTPGTGRLGLTVSTRVGNAVHRNRVKRWLREIYRKHRGLLPPSVDVVIVGRSGAPAAGLARLEAEFAQAARRISGGGSGATA